MTFIPLTTTLNYLVALHALLGEMQVRAELCQLLLMLRHLLDHLGEIPHVLAVALNPLLLVELLQLLRHVLRDDGDVLVPHLHPEVVVLVQKHLLHHALGGFVSAR